MLTLDPLLEGFRLGTGVLVTLVQTTGSTYRKAGARMFFSPEGRRWGSITSGCLEEELAVRAKTVMESGQPVFFTYDMRPRYGCQGSLGLFMERIEAGNLFIETALKADETRKAWKVSTCFEGEEGALGTVVGEIQKAWVQNFLPRPRLILIGESFENPMLMQLAKLLAWEGMIFPEVTNLPPLDPWTAVVVKTHQFGKDLAALSRLIQSPVGYLGMMGPQRRKQEILLQLIESGMLKGSEDLRHLHGPAGLDLGSDRPEEIALSIVAEIQAVLRGHQGGFLRDKKTAIHQKG